MTPQRLLLRAALAQLVPQIDEEVVEHTEEKLSADHFTLTLVLAPRAKTPLPGSNYATGKPLTRIERSILSVCTEQSKQGKRIAREVGHKYDGYIRQLLSGLSDRGLLVRTEEGYRLGERSRVESNVT